ncbi:MAG: rhomboid family intramembrane serine protease [Hasllibacter sp.]
MPPGRLIPLTLALLLAPPILVEGALTAADAGLIGARSWRGTAYGYGAFWSGLLRGWRPNYESQPALMFLSYALLHGGPGHLAGNLAAAVPLGLAVARRLGAAGLAATWLGAGLAGAAAFGILSGAPQPMVGASGMVFGLAGAVQRLQFEDRRARRASIAPVAAGMAALAAANLLIWWWQDGLLAWEAHLGGWFGGWTMAALWRHRSHPFAQ